MRNSIPQPADELVALRAAFHLVRDAVFVVDTRLAQVVDANAAACRLLRLQLDELVGRAWRDVLPHLGATTLCDIGPEQLVVVVPLSADGPCGADIPRD